MAFVKKNWLYLVLGVVAIGSIATAGWAYMSGDEILQKLQDIERIRSEVKQAAGGAQNAETIEAKKEEQTRLIAEQDHVLKSALAPQLYNAFEGRERQLLVSGALPTPNSNAKKFEFKTAYREALLELRRRLRSRAGPTLNEVASEQALIDSKEAAPSDQDRGPWMPEPVALPEPDSDTSVKGSRSLGDLLKSSAAARAAEKVARNIDMYVEDHAFMPQPLFDSQEAPTATQIWHAQMTLWIQQDMAFALNRLNEKRAEQLKAAGKPYDCWVANMPVKHLKNLAGDDVLGRGGLMNRATFAPTFTGVVNDAKRFMVPLQLQLVIEEAALPELLDSICRVGYYTPIRVVYQSVEPNVLQSDYVYGEAPVIEATVDIEAVYFRKVFDQWIPPELAPILTRPRAQEDLNLRR
ncbi:MAG TPA: hypothetical protein VNT79_09820 [Phycisphaerae bacterium]|nr:hypothetical protein [Phycisphaerae bacterium]